MEDELVPPTLPQTSTDNPGTVSITVSYHGAPHTFSLPPFATITDLSDSVASELSIPTANQKFMISKLGLLKAPFKDPALALSTLVDKKISLLGSTAAEVSSLTESLSEAKRQATRSTTAPRQTVKAYKTHDWKKEQEESLYTFTTLRPLPYLPNPERSLAYLQRLKDDAGIKASMRKHRWTVPLLTEMNPVEHTQSNHEGTSRTLGLNRNAGEVIELRLRTDAYDGYRDYKTIRKTLCHELAHNVHGPHDRNFWDLCHQIEREVEAAAGWKSGGQTLSNEEFYRGGSDGQEEDVVHDHGGWEGGEYTLGAASGGAADSSAGHGQGQGMSRRELLARAAEERIRRLREQSGGQDGSGGSSSG